MTEYQLSEKEVILEVDEIDEDQMSERQRQHDSSPEGNDDDDVPRRGEEEEKEKL